MSISKINLKFLKEIFHGIDASITVESYEETLGSTRGDNYTAELYRIYVKGNISKQHDDLTLMLPWETSIIYKCLPENPTRREAFKSEQLFRNEVNFYTKVVPVFEEFLGLKENLPTKKLNLLPTCYRAEKNEIILEDLKARQFEMADRKEGLNLKQLTVVLTYLAKFHALSISIKLLQPEEFFALLDPNAGITECLFVKDNEEWYRGYYKQAIQNVIDMIQSSTYKISKKEFYIRRFLSFADEHFFQKMIDLVSYEGPLSVLCHGDCWTNNLLFKQTDIENEVYFIDFQLCRYGSLALDLANLFYCCTTKKLRDVHLSKLLAKYHSVFSQTLIKYLQNTKYASHKLTDREYTYTLLLSEFKRCALFGLGLAIDIIPISTCNSEDAPDMYQSGDAEQNESTVQAPSANELAAEKMITLICEFVDNSFL